MGYHRAGFGEIVGVDIKPQLRYPFEFVQADALEYVAEHGREFDVIHASPPCQAYTPLKALQKGKCYPDFLAATRIAIQETGLPWVIENVMAAPLFFGIVLCGTMFGLRTYRHRRFEASHLMWQPEHRRHSTRAYAHRVATRSRKELFLAGGFASVTGNIGSYCGPAAMGIDWMTGDELSQAIPPAYTEFIGKQLLRALAR